MNDLMRHPIIMVVLCLMLSLTANAQFHTISSENDTLLLSKDPFLYKERAIKDTAKLGTKSPDSNKMEKKAQEYGEEKIFKGRKNHQKIADFPVLDVSDSLLLALIKKRLSVCMPLSLIYLTSNYGYRSDPFTKCKRFHDGIDLRCNNHVIYSMLQGTVEKTGYDKSGYGNYIVTSHGRLRFLYGHLNEIYVCEGDVIEAGEVIGKSGNSGGRSTGPHLHLQMQRLEGSLWKSVNPTPFIEALNNYIKNVDDMLAEFCGNNDLSPEERLPLTKENLYKALKKHGIKYPKIVLAQAILETGHFSSRVCKDKNNLFGLRHSKGYYDFDHWEESVVAYRDWVQYKYKSGDYLMFLKKIGYASAKDYIYKVRAIAEQL